MSQVHIITGPERRRRWSEEQKRAIVAAAFAPGAVVSEVARRADICTSLIYRWRRRFGSAPVGFAEVMVAPVGHGGGELRGRSAASPVERSAASPVERSAASAVERSAASAVETGRPALADAPSIEVAFTGRSHVRIPASIPPDLAAAVIKALIGR